MTTIYVVTSGEYSDYGIRAMFSTKEKAQQYVDVYNVGEKWDTADIEEWQLDQHENATRRTVYHAQLNTSDGSFHRKWTSEVITSKNAHTLEQNAPNQYYCYGDSFLNYDHAIKLAVESRQAYLREKGITE